MLCEEERIILDYLKANEEVFISPATISRRACPKRFRDKPTWAYPFLTRMFDARIIECDPAGHYRFVDHERKRREVMAKRRREREKW